MNPSPAIHDKASPPIASMSIDQFCERYNITKRWYFMLRNRGEGPTEVRIGAKVVRITETAAAEWEQRHTPQLAAAQAARAKSEAKKKPVT